MSSVIRVELRSFNASLVRTCKRFEGNKKYIWNSERNFRLAIFVPPGVKAYRLLVNHGNKGESSPEL